MPTTYAHWRFGDKCISTLPSNYQDLINKYRDVFDYGVHGPDIFFYYDCIKPNVINKYGSNMHDIPFKDTLSDIKRNYDNAKDKEGALVYLLGFTCHFVLDSYAHGYIERKEEESPYSHGRIESQFDKYLLVKDGYNPIKKSVTFSLKPSRKVAKIIRQVFPEWTTNTIYKVIKDHKLYCDLLKDSNSLKRSLLMSLMKKAKAEKYIDLMITENKYPGIEDAMLRLDKLFDKATEHYPKLALSLIDYLNNNKTLDIYFKNHFCPKADYKKIPVLTFEEEKNIKLIYKNKGGKI